MIVAGAGASGMMAAGRAAEKGAQVILLEKGDRPGRKILISGKCRCNITNTAEIDDFINAFGKNGRFLYSVFHRYFRENLLDFLEKYGVRTKTERGGRIFPLSDNASHVVQALQNYFTDGNVDFRLNTELKEVIVEHSRIKAVKTNSGEIACNALIIATGGSSYKTTGSTGEGYKIAEMLGHKIEKLRPALVPLVVKEIDLAASMQGVGLRNIRLTALASDKGKININSLPNYDTWQNISGKKPKKNIIESRIGEIMFTHFGIGGPVTLLMSLAIVKALEKGQVSINIDLKPALSLNQLEKRLQKDFEKQSKKTFKNIMKGLVPSKMITPLIEICGISPEKEGHEISATERKKIALTLKSIRFNIDKPLPLNAAIVTSGGVSLKEIDPATMSSRIIKGLYFCGEVLDLDADTGGYNLQAAFSTGFIAGNSAATINGN